MKYCEFCGQPINNCTCEKGVQARVQAKKTNKRLFLGGVVALAVAIILCVVLLWGNSVKMDPFEYITVSFSGYNNQGTAEIEFNKDPMIRKIVGEAPSDGEDIEGLEKYFIWEEKYDYIADCITYSCEPNEWLKNGDTVTLYIWADGEASKRINSGSKEFVVEGLEVLDPIDIFKDLRVAFDGISGKASVDFERTTLSDALIACDFDVDPMYNLKNGDKVTISIKNADYLAEEFHVMPAELKKEYIVEGLGSYVTSADQIPDDMIKEFADRFLKEKSEEIEEDFIFSYSDVEYYGSYLYIGNSDSWLANANELRIYVYCDEYMNDEYYSTVYYPIIFKNIIVNPDGSLSIDYDDGSSAIFTTDIEAHFADEEKSYIITRID